MEDFTRKNRILEALELRGMKQIELAERTGIARGTINNWAKQKYQPKSRPLNKMAKVLEVTELWLAGYPVPMERPIEQVRGDKKADIVRALGDNDRLIDIVAKLPSLTASQLDIIEPMIKEFAKLNQKN